MKYLLYNTLFKYTLLKSPQTDLATFTVGQRRGGGGWGSWCGLGRRTKTTSGEMKHNLDMRASVNYVLIN